MFLFGFPHSLSCAKPIPAPALVLLKSQVSPDFASATSFHVEDRDVKSAVDELLRSKSVAYHFDDDLQEKVSVDMVDMPLISILRTILNQADATFRIEADTVYITRKQPKEDNPGSAPTDMPSQAYAWPADQEMRLFDPGRFSASYNIRNSSLFFDPDRTIGSSYRLLLQAATGAGFGEWYSYRYGREGFAIVLPFEATESDGHPKQGSERFRFHPDLGRLDFRTLSSSTAAAFGPLNLSYRIQVLILSTDPVDSRAVSRQSGLSGSKDMGSVRWTKLPQLTLLVYQFKADDVNGFPHLLQQGEPQPSARNQAIFSGLWLASQLPQQ